MPVCLSHGGISTYLSESPSTEVLVGTVHGVVAIEREHSKAWGVTRRSLEEFHISALLVERTKGLIFAGAHKGSLYVSGDGGRNWELRDRGLSHKDVYALGQGDGKLYVGTEPAHLFESSDLGARWEELPALRSAPSVPQWTFPGPPHIAHVKNIALDPSDPKKIYVAVEVGALLKSEDGGLSWQELDGFDDAHRVVVHPAKPNWVYFSHGGRNYGIFLSRDGGKSWERLTPQPTRIGYPDPLLLHPEREGLMFIAGAKTGPGTWRETGTADARIARSRDGGKSWEILENGLPDHIRGNIEAMAMEVWEGGYALFAATTDGEIFYSDDEGESWSKIAENLPPVSKGGHYRALR